MLVDATGGRRWLLRTLIRGKRCDVGLGTVRFGDDELKKIRTTARDLRDVARKGGDPLAIRRDERARLAAATVAIKSFREVAEEYIEAKRPEWTNPKHAAQWESTLEVANDAFGEVAVHLVNSIHIVGVLKPIWTTKSETASRLRARIAAVLDAAKARGLRTGDNPAEWKGALQASLPANQAKAKLVHHPALPYTAIAAFLADIQAQPGTAARALEFAILTAGRTGEVVGAQWNEIDEAEAVWNVPAERMKAKKPHRVPLTDRVIEILAEQRLVAVTECAVVRTETSQRFVFESAFASCTSETSKPLSNMAMLAVLKRMERTDITVHGFRSTFRDWAGEQTAYPREVIEHALAHRLADKAEAAYQRGDLLRKRWDLMDEWSTYCATKRPAKAEVPRIGRGAA